MPANSNYPGVYIQELPSGVRTIPGVQTSITAFIGQIPKGPVNQPMHILSFADFEKTFGTFGPLTVDQALGYAVRQFFLNGGNDAWIVRIPDAAADQDWRAALAVLEAVDLFNLLVLPGLTEQVLQAEAAAYCEKRRAFLILDAPGEITTPAAMKAYLESKALPLSKNAAVYFPWVGVAEAAAAGGVRWCPPSGTIAGLMARTDANRGVWKAPAGTDAVLRGVQSLRCQLVDGENAELNSLGINCLRHFPIYGHVAWGSRTMVGADAMASDWKYIPVRRLALFLEESLYPGTKWVVFEPNDEPLRAQIRLNVGAFMHNLFRQGAFQGTTPKEAYFVKCDKETTTQNDINLGIVNLFVGFAPLKPAEFTVIKIQQMAGQIQ